MKHLNKYKLELDFPHCLNISGGKSSAYMLHKIILANELHKQWPETIKPVFTNTGLEMEQTYQFLHDIETHWNVPLVWLEMIDKKHGLLYEQVDFQTANRNGEPFTKLVSDGFLPTPYRRTCTYNLKVLTMKKYMRNTFAQPYNLSLIHI